LNNFFVTYQIPIPPSVSFAFRTPEEGSQFIFNSERGSIRLLIPARFSCLVQERIIHLSCTDPHLYAEFRTVIGALYRTLLGVTKGYRKKLKTVGMGYKGGVEKNHLMKMVLGYSHPVYYLLDQTTSIKFGRKNNRFNLQGPNHLITYQTAADLHSFKEPDVYKGKGVRYRGFKLLKKEGKKKK
jgi:large subunit ribosomal protein L6